MQSIYLYRLTYVSPHGNQSSFHLTIDACLIIDLHVAVVVSSSIHVKIPTLLMNTTFVNRREDENSAFVSGSSRFYGVSTRFPVISVRTGCSPKTLRKKMKESGFCSSYAQLTLWCMLSVQKMRGSSIKEEVSNGQCGRVGKN